MPEKPLPPAKPLLECFLATFDSDAPAELARLAAAMAGTPEAFDAGELLRRALALREGAAGVIAGRRAALLREAGKEALREMNDALQARGHAQADPSRTAIRIEQTRRNMEARAPGRVKEDREWRAILRQVESESGIPCPALPCLRNDALRWAVSAPEWIPLAKIEGAFLDFLTAHAQELHGLPAAEFMARHWSASRECDAQALCELAEGFRVFWQDNDCAGRFAVAMAAQNETSRKRASAGSKASKKKGAETRVKNMWLRIAADFKKSAGTALPNADSIAKFLPVKKGERDAVKRRREFLRTMLHAHQNPSVRASLHEPLWAIGIRLPANAARKCYGVIFGK